jgi:membrane fusion protein, multidrug efflux system
MRVLSSKSNVQKIWVAIVAVVVVVIGTSIFVAETSANSKKAAQGFERPPAPVTTVAAMAQDVPIYLDEIGKCVAREMVSIQPQVSGRITQIHFQDGQELHQGDLLFVIDPRPYQAALHQAEATLAQQKAALEFANLQLTRAAGLVGEKAIPQEEYDTRKNAVAVCEAQVQQSAAAVETARLNVEYTAIRSPINGRAGHRLVDIGNVVTANSGSLLTLQRLDPIYSDFTVTENDLTAVQRNMTRGTLRVEVRLPDEPDAPVKGELTFLDNAVQDGSGTVTLRATVPNANHRLWPGRFVKVRLVLSTLPGAVLVPASATQMSAKGDFVYVVKDDSTAELRPVKLGQRQGDLVVVVQGLKPGEHVVANGQLGVTPGGKVLIQPQNAQPANAQQPKGGSQPAQHAGGQS